MLVIEANIPQWRKRRGTKYLFRESRAGGENRDEGSEARNGGEELLQQLSIPNEYIYALQV